MREAPLAASDFAACGLLALVGTDASSRRHASGLHLASPLGPRAKPSNFFFFFFCVKIREGRSYVDQLASDGNANGMRMACNRSSWRKSAKFNADGTNSIQMRIPRRAMRRCIELTNRARSGEDEEPFMAAALAAVLSAK